VGGRLHRRTNAERHHLPKRPNYNFEKRRRELDKQRKKEEKRQRKIDEKRAAEGLPPLPPPEDPGPPQRH